MCFLHNAGAVFCYNNLNMKRSKTHHGYTDSPDDPQVSSLLKEEGIRLDSHSDYTCVFSS